MKTHVEKYCEQTSLVGLHYAIDAPYKLERVFWAVGFAISLFLALWMVKDAVNGWVENPVQIVVETTNFPTSSIPFPAVSVLPHSQLDKKSSYVSRWKLHHKILGWIAVNENSMEKLSYLYRPFLDQFYEQSTSSIPRMNGDPLEAAYFTN